MAGRFEKNPFAEEEEVNPFAVSLFSHQKDMQSLHL